MNRRRPVGSLAAGIALLAGFGCTVGPDYETPEIAMPDAFAEAHRRIAYERLLLDLIKGDQTLFVRRDEVEAQWQWIEATTLRWFSIRPGLCGRGAPTATANSAPVTTLIGRSL